MEASLINYQVISRPNNSLTAAQRIRLLLVLAIIPVLVALGFMIAGMWVVLPFFGLELAALGYAFYYVNCHAKDFESITMENDYIIVERRDHKYTEKTVLSPYWAQVVLQDEEDGGLHLYLRCHGKNTEVGRYMDKEQKAVFAAQLRQRTGNLGTHKSINLNQGTQNGTG